MLINTQRGFAAPAAIIIAIIVILGGGAWYFTQDKSPEGDSVMEDDAMMEENHDGDTMMEDEEMMEGDSMMEKDSDTMMEGSGSYEVYSTEKLARADEGDVVLFFRAKWCPTCNALNADIKENISSIPAGVTILEVDYDTAKDLKRKYSVTYQHTLVQVDSLGERIAKWSGSPTLSSIISNIK